MVDYPKTIEEFEAKFSSEETCREYLFQLRWPEGFRCPVCGNAASAITRLRSRREPFSKIRGSR